MNEDLFNIVRRGPLTIRGCLNRGALLRHTQMIDFQQGEKFEWEKVAYLYVFNVPPKEVNELALSQGIYFSEDGTWALLLGNIGSSVQRYIDRCIRNLLSLFVRISSETKFDKCIAVDLSKGHKLLTLNVSTMRNSVRVNGIAVHHDLESLYLRNVVSDAPLDFQNMPKLKELCVHTFSPYLIAAYSDKCMDMERLDLFGVSWNGCIDLSYYPNLKSLDLMNNKRDSGFECKFRGLDRLTKLKSLRLGGNCAETLDVLPASPGLERLWLEGCTNLTTIEGLEAFPDLMMLILRNIGIKHIPEGIRQLKKLRYLEFRFLDLEELPYWLSELHIPIGNINLTGTKVKGVDMSIFDQPEEVIRQWFKDLKNKSMVPLREAKVVFLGDGEAGKTHTIARLLNNGGEPQEEHFDDRATPGIVIQNKTYDIDGQSVNVHFWDFGGQEILHSMHRMFLTERTLYVVLLNARDDTQDNRARYWLHNIRSFAEGAPVLLVLNKTDQNPNASVNEKELKTLYTGLRGVVNLSALTYSPEQFNNTLTTALLEQIRQLGTIETLWPTSWANLKTALETMKSNFISGSEYARMCQDNGVKENKEELLRWFNDLGTSFCYQGNRTLRNYVILRPEWITNGIYTLLFNKCEETKQGVIPKEAIYEMLNPQEEGKYRQVLKGVTYTDGETEYVLAVMRKFGLSYGVSEEAEFIPALCPRETPDIAEEYEQDPNTLEFQLSYDYLPENVIHRLMVEMRQDLNLSYVWRTGALFCQHGTKLSAVVKSEGNVLRIFVRSEDSMHRPNTYLCILKNNIDRINGDMKLKEPYAEVVYKTEQGKEGFDYEDLLLAQRDGEETYRSKMQRKSIPIQDILNQTGRVTEQALTQLRKDILSVCLQLQGNQMYRGSTEDQRNTFMRDSLRNRGYLVNDQTFQGVGGGGRSFGELDLEIRQEENIPWTIIEALRVKDGSKAEWNKHLQKLLDNYNTGGLRHLFLLTYVDCEKEKFKGLIDQYVEHIKWYDPLSYARMGSSFSHQQKHMLGEPAFIEVMQHTYDRGGIPTTVTHIFVRMDK